jgi:hypothetical protein
MRHFSALTFNKSLKRKLVQYLSQIIILRSVFYRARTYKVNKLNRQWQNIDFVMENIKSIVDLGKFYESNKHIPEIEHQVGRFINMCKIVNQMIPKNKETIVEFGTYQGLSILLLDYAFTSRSHSMSNDSKREFVGIDTFRGLPESSSIWKKGQFHDTSIDICEKNIRKWINPVSEFELISGRFNDSNVSKRLSQYSNISVFHFDADLGSSTKEALQVLHLLLLKKQSSVYFLFDDWGCHPDEVPDAFYNWYLENQNELNLSATKISSTKNSRYYRIDFA